MILELQRNETWLLYISVFKNFDCYSTMFIGASTRKLHKIKA